MNSKLNVILESLMIFCTTVTAILFIALAFVQPSFAQMEDTAAGESTISSVISNSSNMAQEIGYRPTDTVGIESSGTANCKLLTGTGIDDVKTIGTPDNIKVYENRFIR